MYEPSLRGNVLRRLGLGGRATGAAAPPPSVPPPASTITDSLLLATAAGAVSVEIDALPAVAAVAAVKVFRPLLLAAASISVAALASKLKSPVK